jgi:hypothetical protein
MRNRTMRLLYQTTRKGQSLCVTKMARNVAKQCLPAAPVVTFAGAFCHTFDAQQSSQRFCLPRAF